MSADQVTSAPASSGKELQDKVALVTGSARGIGRAIALKLSSQGAKVVLNYRGNEALAQAVLDQITTAGGDAIVCQADVGQQAEVQRLFTTIAARWESVDILVNNAGITRDNLLLRMSEADWDAVLTTNLKGAYLCTKAALRGMLKRREGRVINIASVVGLLGNAGQANYAAAKSGLIALTKSTAREVGSRGITANAIAPGFIQTDMTEGLSEKQKQQVLAEIPLGRFGQVEDVAELVGFLASPRASYITGQVLAVDGGMVMH